MSEVTYSLTKVDTGEEARVFHVVNLQPFHMWATASPSKSARHLTPQGQSPGSLECNLSSDRDCPELHVSRVGDMEAADVFMDVPAEDNACDTDSVPILPAQNSVQETDEMTLDT